MSNSTVSSDNGSVNNLQIDDFSSKQNTTKLNKYYIKHIDNDKIYCLNNSWKNSLFLIEVIDKITDDYGSKENPIILNNVIKEHTIEFIVNYLNYYGKKTESKPPQSPLPSLDIDEIFGDEYVLFKDIVNKDEDIKFNLNRINEFIIASNYFNIEFLTKKLCAIIAHLLKCYKGELNDLL